MDLSVCGMCVIEYGQGDYTTRASTSLKGLRKSSRSFTLRETRPENTNAKLALASSKWTSDQNSDQSSSVSLRYCGSFCCGRSRSRPTHSLAAHRRDEH